jgi:hypothetical protein
VSELSEAIVALIDAKIEFFRVEHEHPESPSRSERAGGER